MNRGDVATGEVPGSLMTDNRVKRKSGLWVRLYAERFGLLAAWLVAIVIFSILAPTTFFTLGNLQTIFASQTILLCITLALILSLSAGEYDLSIAAVAGSVGTFVAFFGGSGIPLWLALAFALIMILAIGALHALLIVGLGIPSLVVTLGTSTLLVGITIGVAGPQPLVLTYTGLSDLANVRIIGLPFAWYAIFVLVLVMYYLLEHTPFGRYVHFVGGSPEVARLSGIPVNRVRIISLMGSTSIGGMAGLALIGIQGSSDITISNALLMPAFAGAFLGATAITPGRFNVWGTVAAVYFLVTGITGLQLLGFAGWVEQVFYGTSLIVAVAIGRLIVHTVDEPRA